MKRKITMVILLTAIIAALSACSFTKDRKNAASEKDAGSSTAVEQTASSDDTTKENGTADEDKITLNLYFANSDKTAILAEKREINTDGRDDVRAAMEALIDGPTDQSLKRTIPEDARLIDVDVDDGTAVVNFSRELLNENGMVGIIEKASIVNTLTDIDGIRKVKILVEGKDLLNSGGLPLGELKRYETDEQGHLLEGETKTVTLYFANAGANGLVAESREIYVFKHDPIEAEVFYELAKGPVTQGLYPTIPEGTRILSVETEDGICKLNLSEEFIDNAVGGSAGELVTVYSIVNTLTELPGIEKVQFLIDGKVREAYIHLEFSEPFERNEKAIDK